jgi:hypothetical protein
MFMPIALATTVATRATVERAKATVGATIGLRSLESALPLEVELALHGGILGGGPLLLSPALGLAVQHHVTGETAGGAADQHAGRVGAEQKPAGTGAGGSAGHGSDSRRPRSAGVLAAGECQDGNAYQPRDSRPSATRFMRRSHDPTPCSASTASTISSKDRAPSSFLSPSSNARVFVGHDLGKGQHTIAIGIDTREHGGVVRAELLRRQSLAAIGVEPAEPGGRVPREFALTDQAVAIGIGGIERQTLVKAWLRACIVLLGHSRPDYPECHRDGDIS